MYKTGFLILCIALISCGEGSKKYPCSAYSIHYDGVLDSILPFFAKLHDSIPFEKRFNPEYREYMNVHKKEREYTWLYYTQEKDGYSYFMIYRNEPSIKKDKYASLCGRFKRNSKGQIDSSSFEELFWTWKMKKQQLLERSEILFAYYLKNGNVDKYQPGKMEGEWVEFPGLQVEYNVKTKLWEQKRF